MAAAKDLKTPLLPASDDQLHGPQLILDVNDHPDPSASANQCSISINTQLDFDENPYAFIGSNGFEVPGSTTVDPFRNHTPRIEGVYECVKVLVCAPITLLRLVLFAFCLAVGYLATKFALHGWKDKHNPMPKWRCRVMWITRLCTRGILFAFGYHWIQRKGKPAPREIAPIIVSNHVSYIDPIFFFYELFPTIVASESHDSMPFVGTIIRAMQVIYVDRFSQQSRKHAVNEIKEMVVLLRRKGTMSFSLMATRIRALMAEKTGTETDGMTKLESNLRSMTAA